MRRASGAPAGCTLVEVVVAMTVLATGVLAAVGTTTLAARWLREAEARAEAARLAAGVLDSLAQSQAPAAGERRDGRHRLRWTLRPAGGATAIELAVEYEDGTARRAPSFTALYHPLPPVLGGDR